MIHPHSIHSDQMYRHSRGGACLVGFAMAMHLTAGQDGKHVLAEHVRANSADHVFDCLPINLAGRYGVPSFSSYRTRDFLSLISGRRNRMAECAKRQTRAGIRIAQTSGQFGLTTDRGGVIEAAASPTNTHRRVCSSLSRRYWHGVQRKRSAVPFLIRGADIRSHFHCVDYVPAKFANRPHHNRAFPFPPSSDGSKTIGKDLTRWSQSLSPDDKTYD